MTGERAGAPLISHTPHDHHGATGLTGVAAPHHHSPIAATEPKSTIFTKGPHITDTGNRLDPVINEGGFALPDGVLVKPSSTHDASTSIGSGLSTTGAAGATTGAVAGAAAHALPHRTATDDRITKPVDINRENELAGTCSFFFNN